MALEEVLGSLFCCEWKVGSELDTEGRAGAISSVAVEEALVFLVRCAASAGETLLYQLISCSSAEKPYKIYAIILEKLEGAYQATEAFPRTDSPAMALVRIGTFYRYIGYVMERLAPAANESDASGVSYPEYEILVDKYSAFGCKALLSILTPGAVPSTTAVHFILHESMHFYDFIGLSVRGKYVVFETLVNIIMKQWSEFPRELLLTIYNLLHQYLSRFEAAALIAQSRDTINRYLTHVSGQSSSADAPLVPQNSINELRLYMSSI